MAPKRDIIGFELSVSARDDGTVEAVYIRLRDGKVAKTREIIEDVLLADYDPRGELLGVEILAPVKMSDLTRLVQQARRMPFRRFIKQTAPPRLIVA